MIHPAVLCGTLLRHAHDPTVGSHAVGFDYLGNVVSRMSLDSATRRIRDLGIEARKNADRGTWDEITVVPVSLSSYDAFDSNEIVGTSLSSAEIQALQREHGHIVVQHTVNFSQRDGGFWGSKLDLKLKCRIHDAGTLRRLTHAAKHGNLASPGRALVSDLFAEDQVYLSVRYETSGPYREWGYQMLNSLG